MSKQARNAASTWIRLPEEKRRVLERAAKLVRARRPEEVPRLRRGESRVIEHTSDWFYGSPGVRGLAIGYKFSSGGWVDDIGLQVFVRKKRRLKRGSSRRIKDFTLQGTLVRTDVIELHDFCHQIAVGDLIGNGLNCGTVAAFLRGKDGEMYVLSAAHVLCETYGQNTPSNQRLIISKGDAIYAFDANGVQTQTRVGELFDRRILDFSNVYTLENVDAAIAMLLDSQKAIVAQADIPYSTVGTASINDSVRIVGGASRTDATSGLVRSWDYAPRTDQYLYAANDGIRRPIYFEQLYLAEYSSQGGDSGGMVVRDGDKAAVGLHIGRNGTEAGSLAVFFDITRIVSAWPLLTIVTSN